MITYSLLYISAWMEIGQFNEKILHGRQPAAQCWRNGPITWNIIAPLAPSESQGCQAPFLTNFNNSFLYKQRTNGCAPQFESVNYFFLDSACRKKAAICRFFCPDFCCHGGPLCIFYLTLPLAVPFAVTLSVVVHDRFYSTSSSSSCNGPI
jgi:hypothetical protein